MNTTKYLAIDTSSRYLTVIARNGEKLCVRHNPECAMRHSVILMGEIDAALKEAGLTPADCEYFAAVTGPGSFTGIRIGIATAKGFALATGKPLKPVTVFDMLAYNVNSGTQFLVCVDAAHGHFYACGYEGAHVTLPPRYISREEVEGLGLPVCGFEDLPFENYTKLDPEECLLNAVERIGVSPDMHATYVRKSQAEENLGGN